MSQLQGAFVNIVSDLVDLRIEPQTSRFKDICIIARPTGQVDKNTFFHIDLLWAAQQCFELGFVVLTIGLALGVEIPS